MQHYTLKAFLRTAPNELLAEYFKRAGWLSEIAFDKLKPRKIEPLFDAIQQLPDTARATIDTDFQDISALSHEAGVTLLLHEAQYHDADFIESFAPLKGHCAKAFWVFLHHKAAFEQALSLACRDNLTGHWRKRKQLPVLIDPDFSNKIKPFESAIADYFRSEGRGRVCIVDYKNRGRLHYFFAYPEDYSQSYLHYENGALKRGSHSPAFEVFFIYDTKLGALDIYHSGSSDAVKCLQEIFAKQVLGLNQLSPCKKDAYELDALKHNRFQFKLRPEWGIERVSIVQLGVSRFLDREPRQWILKCGNYPDAIYEELDIVAPYHPQNGLPSRSNVMPCSTRIRVEFMPQQGKKRAGKRTFNLTHDGCNLKYEGRDLILRQMLADSGLEGINERANYIEQSVLQPA